MSHPPFDTLYEDNHLLVVNKPAGLATIGVSPDRPSLVKAAKTYIKRRYRKPGNVYLGVMSRLDAPVSGVVVLARTSKAATRLSDQFRERRVEKVYWALVEELLDPPTGEWTDWLIKDERNARMKVASSHTASAQEARLRYCRLARLATGVLVEIELLTGRKHQIRVQFASHGAPILGDRKYGATTPFPSGIALHSRRLAFTHPVRGEEMAFTAEAPKSWPKLPLTGDELNR